MTKKITRPAVDSTNGAAPSTDTNTTLAPVPEPSETNTATVLDAQAEADITAPDVDMPDTVSEAVPVPASNTADKKSGSSRSSKKPRMLRRDQLKLLEEFRVREEECPKTIAEYVNKYKEHVEDVIKMLSKDPSKVRSIIPPLGALHVWREKKVDDEDKPKGKDEYIVVAGWHRVLAAEQAGVPYLPCIVHTDRNAAIKAALETNRHGKQLSKADKKRSIEMALAQDPELSSKDIADRLGCSKRSVEVIIKEYNLHNEETDKQKKPRVSKERTSAALLLDEVKAILTPALKSKCTNKQRFVACIEALELLAETDGIREDKDCLEAFQKTQDIFANHSAA